MFARRYSLATLMMLGIMTLRASVKVEGSEDAGQSGGTAFAPLPPAEAIKRMTLPEGFNVALFAREPDVVQPIAFTIDPRGRLWVVENYAYPLWLGGPKGKDRVLILEDIDGDGHFDRRTTFLDG